jgi:SAM-dependent methyltransferase
MVRTIANIEAQAVESADSMGDANQLALLQHWVPRVDGPVLEVGSREYGSTSSFRDFYAGAEYVGVDMSEGDGVDVVVDLVRSTGPLAEGHFALAICCSVLEHVEKPWLFAANLTRLVRPGGLLYMSVPWVWRYHPYPDDYFRFSHRGVMSLFGEFAWKHAFYSSTAPGEFLELGEEAKGLDEKLSFVADAGSGRKRKYLPYLMVNMLGRKL